ncbi:MULTISPECIES: hypothetical protein [unclassified Bradyrhizobium]
MPDEYGSDSFEQAVKFAAVLGVGQSPKKPNNEYTRNRHRIGKALTEAIKSAKQRAKTSGLIFDLDLEWAIQEVEAQDLRCALTNVPFYFHVDAISRQHPFAPSLDRIRPGGDYTKSNVRIVCFAMNVMLLDWGFDVFEKMAMAYRRTKNKTSIPAPDGLRPAPK